jgi:hypothetical protein
MNASMNYLDGNAAAGELSRIFAADITSAEGKCANCGAKKSFAEAHLYMRCPGLVARCALCGHVLLRFTNVRGPFPRRSSQARLGQSGSNEASPLCSIWAYALR